MLPAQKLAPQNLDMSPFAQNSMAPKDEPSILVNLHANELHQPNANARQTSR